MLSALAQLSLVVAAEKSKVPFYIAGAVLVAWALVVSAGLGLRHATFPGNLTGQRVVMAITAVQPISAVMPLPACASELRYVASAEPITWLNEWFSSITTTM